MSGVTRGRQGKKNGYYACNARFHKRVYGRACDMPYFRVDAVDAVIWEWVKGVLLEPTRLTERLSHYQDAQRAALRPFYRMLESSERELASLTSERERLIEAYTKGVLSLDDIAKRKDKLDRQLEDTGQAMERLRADLVQKAPSAQTMETLERLAQHVREGAGLADADAEKQRQVYRLIQLQVTLDEVDGHQVAQVECMLGQLQLSASSETACSFGSRLTIRTYLLISASSEQLANEFFKAVLVSVG